MECGDDGIINKWLVRRVSQGIPNFSTLVQKWSSLSQYSRLAKREELLCCAIAIFYSSHPTLDHLHDLSSMSKSKFWGKCLSRFKLKGKGWNEEEKKTVTKVATLESLRVNIINVSSNFSIFTKGCLTAL